MVDGSGHLSQQRRWLQAVAGHDYAEAQACGLHCQRAEQSPRLQGRLSYVSTQGKHLIPEPGVFEDWHAISLKPQRQDFVVRKALLAGL
jgi:hypothetical protein